jgi:diguanylate cyclase (GGDEF)-like protein
MRFQGKVVSVIFVFAFWISMKYSMNNDAQILLLILFLCLAVWFGSSYDRLVFSAEHDYLTKLANRRFLIHRYKNYYKKNFSILLIDIDQFKEINDQYGHDRGDEILKDFSIVLRSNTRRNDIVCRWGGDEFVIFLSDVTKEDTEKIAGRIKNIIKENTKLSVIQSISIGISYYPDDSIDIKQLITLADENMYQIKSR